MVLALVEREGLLAQANWHPTLFANADWLPLPQMRVPTEVETVVNHRVLGRKHIIAGISGGVWIDAKQTLAVQATSAPTAKVKVAPQPPLQPPLQAAQKEAAQKEAAQKESVNNELVWWWD